jgi:hypothetical protein
MDAAQDRARFDWLVETVGASALALAVGFAGLKAAPPLGAGTPAAILAAGLAFALGALAIRAVPAGAREHVLPPFVLVPTQLEELLLDCPEGELLLDMPLEEPLLLQHVPEEGVLLLDDPLVESDPGLRVVQLFAAPSMLTPGQLRERIEQHLATGAMHVVREFEGPAPDASDALYAALSDLRRSLR